MNRLLLTCLSTFAVLSIAPAQAKKTLTVGDPAPPLRLEAWVKGEPFKFEKGKVYVVEFWATWCGPCIESMPRLSNLADRMKGKVQIVSVNVSDRSPAGESDPGSKVHVDRITNWVKANADKMRYNVALDDSAGTMSKTWMSASGQVGIPCAFVIDQKQTIAWIGHPDTGLAHVVELVYAKKFDKKSAQNQYRIDMKVPRAAQAEQDKLKKLAATGNLDAVEKAYLQRLTGPQNPDIAATSLLAYELSKKHPMAALGFVQNRSRRDMRGENTIYGGTLVYIAPNFKGNKEATKALIKFSLETTNTVRPENAAIQYAYHARVLLAFGDLAGARSWLDKADTKLKIYEPEAYRKNMKKYIDDSRKRVELAAKGQ